VTKKTWIIFGIICLGVLGGLIYAASRNNVTLPKNLDVNAIQSANSANGQIADHVFGDAKSPVVLIEYGDFECPYCGEAYPQVKTVTDKYQGQIAFIFRNLPLTTVHPNALAAAGAAEAAGLQGKYWQMHNLLYEDQNNWVNDSVDDRTNAFVGYANQLGLNVSKFKTDLSSDQVTQKINYDIAVFKTLGIDMSTPTFYLNGKQVSQDVAANIISGDGSKLDSAIASLLKQHNIALPASDTK
jgi:protein-disulfide isomerase